MTNGFMTEKSFESRHDSRNSIELNYPSLKNILELRKKNQKKKKYEKKSIFHQR